MAYEDDNEAAKLTEKMRAEISNEGKIDDMVKPLDVTSLDDKVSTTGNEIADRISPGDVEREYERKYETPKDIEPEDDTFIETAKAKSKSTKARRISTADLESKSLSKLHNELRKHSDARKKTDLAITDIEKQLKALLLAHHSAIRDLRKEVGKLRRSVAAESRKITTKGRTGKRGTKKPSNTRQKKHGRR